MNWTKGEWKVKEEWLHRDYEDLNVTSGGILGGTIAHIVRHNAQNISLNESRANANLIAAAPDMYEALQITLQALEEMRLYTGTRIIIKKALQKADGRL